MIADNDREGDGSVRHVAGITFRNATAFWVGSTASAVGVVLHLPMYIGARGRHYRMAGMHPDITMMVGMALIISGMALSFYGLIPKSTPENEPRADVRVAVMGDTRITPTMARLLVLMALAVVIDAMKPITLAFVAPGMAKEYGLTSPANPHGGLPVALLPLCGIIGTVIGSFMWGWLGDRIGRRASIILAGQMFMTTAICGTMPSYTWNLFMCFMMGVGAGGMLPITYTVMAESMPSRHRGWLMVLIGGLVTGTYALVSWMAGVFIPVFTWRVMWLVGLPTGLLLIMLSRWIPESPRYLFAHGRTAEAEATLRRYGAEIVSVSDDEHVEGEVVGHTSGRFSELFGRPLLGTSTAIVLLGIGLGFVTYGFQLWIPSNLQKAGYAEAAADAIIRDSALLGSVLTLVAAWMYGFWSSRKTILLLTVITVVALTLFAVMGTSVVSHRTLLYALLAIPIWASGSAAAALGAYSSEIYPTRIRGRGSGLAAGTGKAGGVLVIALVVAAVAAPSVRVTALLGTVPLMLAVAGFVMFGLETSRRRLEEISTAAEASLVSGVEALD